MHATPKTMMCLLVRSGIALLATTGLHASLQAATTDISQTPLVTASGTPVKPNLMFILDDSGSMKSIFLPEDAGMGSAYYSELTAQCNGLAYDPAGSYPTPLVANGSSVADASTSAIFAANNYVSSPRGLSPSSMSIVSSGSITIYPQGGTAKSSWYAAGDLVTVYNSTSPSTWMLGKVSTWDASTRKLVIAVSDASTTGNLSNATVGDGQPPVYYYKYTGGQTKLDYTYSATGSVVTTTNFYKECNSKLGVDPGASVFTRVVMTPASADLQKYANWYAFYSTRIKMMKTVVSQAFKDIDDKFRVGFTTILNTNADEVANDKGFLHVRDFDGTQKAAFYDSLNATVPTNYTPLRGAIAKAGQYFARKAPGQSTDTEKDPMQYSCQKNFAILATDGAWNTNDESTTAPKYGPYKLDNTNAVGQQDGTADRPMRDNNSTSSDSKGTLADVAMYYYSTDLRTKTLDNCTGSKGVDVCENNVTPLGKDTAVTQHMSTYTMSLGQSGTIKYDPNYEKQASGDFYNIVQGTKQWPNPSNDPTKVDDLWHAAVNGRGVFFNAKDPSAVGLGLKTALSAIAQVTAAGSAAATSTLRPVAGDNQVFVARYTSSLWIGDLRSYRLDTDGNPLFTDVNGTDLADWSAATQLKSNAGRKIYYGKGGTTLREFTYANLSADGFAADFDNQCGKMSQCAVLSGADKTTANSGSTLVSYLRGVEQTVYRSRDSVLGDIIGSGPLFVGSPKSGMSDSGYGDFKAAQANRKGVVYVGANDGMMHAFDKATGNELWAFIPTAVRSNLYKLADVAYTTNHQFYVDSSPVAADISVGGTWRTVMVFGMGAGGKSYVAMDITNPTSPALLWEYTNANLGYTFAKPTIVKRANGEWVVVVPSGYNNVGDGVGRMFVLNALTGAKITEIATSAGSVATPSGLGPIRAWSEKSSDFTASRYYAGDLLGNVWRFDLDGLVEPKNSAMLLAQLKVGAVPQPITTAPELALVDQKGFLTPAVFVGTGRMLGLTDLPDVAQQSIYGIKDTLAAVGLGEVRTSGTLVQQGLTTSGQVRTATNNPVDWSTKNGWFVDLPDAGERINISMQMSGSTLLAGSNVPQSVASCTSGGGYSWLYYLNIANGSNTGKDVGIKIPDSMIVGFTRTTKGVLVQRSTKPLENKTVPSNKIFLKKANKTSWRELAG